MCAPSTARPRGIRLARSPWFIAAMVVLRAFALIVAVQTTGAAHFVSDLIQASVGEPHVGDDCSDDGDGDGCPPGCPSCHGPCSASASLPPVAGEELVQRPPAERAPPARIPVDREPSSPDTSPLFRPPRAAAASLS